MLCHYGLWWLACTQGSCIFTRPNLKIRDVPHDDRFSSNSTSTPKKSHHSERQRGEWSICSHVRSGMLKEPVKRYILALFTCHCEVWPLQRCWQGGSGHALFLHKRTVRARRLSHAAFGERKRLAVDLRLFFFYSNSGFIRHSLGTRWRCIFYFCSVFIFFFA